MSTREIPEKDWASFLEGFASAHRTWRVTVETLDPVLGAQVMASDTPLAGLTLGGPKEIELSLGDPSGSELTRVLKRVTRIYLKSTTDGRDEALEIELAD